MSVLWKRFIMYVFVGVLVRMHVLMYVPAWRMRTFLLQFGCMGL
jgi:hypothetical protein